MIRAKIVSGKTFRSNLLKFSDIELFHYICDHFDPTLFTCPHCGQKGCFERICTYSRMLITVENGKRTLYDIDVINLKCSCGHWHALLSDILIPYASYSARFILHVLEQYLQRTCSVASLCEKWEIAISTLYDWIHRFTDHYNLWAGIMKTISWVTQQAVNEISSYVDLAAAFFERFPAFSFLQGYRPPVSPPRSGPTDSS